MRTGDRIVQITPCSGWLAAFRGTKDGNSGEIDILSWDIAVWALVQDGAGVQWLEGVGGPQMEHACENDNFLGYFPASSWTETRRALSGSQSKRMDATQRAWRPGKESLA